MSREEQGIQITIVQGLRAALPSGWRVVHVANKPRSKVAGATEKRMGAVAGWPDLMVLGRLDDQPFTGFIEVKSAKGKLSKEQRSVRDDLKDLGFPYLIARSWQDVITVAEILWKLPVRIRA